MSWYAIMDKKKYKKPKRNLNYFINKSKFDNLIKGDENFNLQKESKNH